MTTPALSNPGDEGAAGDVCLERAIANIAAFVGELGVVDPSAAVTMRSPAHDGTGRYRFVLHRGIRTVDVDMPGLPIGEVRCTEDLVPPRCPRLYVDGNSWWWCFAIGWARRALDDHDGAIERRVEESRRATDAELGARPRCAACGAVRARVHAVDGSCEAQCYACIPRIEERRETHAGAVYGDDGWRHKSHFLVRRRHMAPEAPGHENPMHPDALCGNTIYRRDGGTDSCRLRCRHDGRCDPYWKEIERTLVMPDLPGDEAIWGSS